MDRRPYHFSAPAPPLTKLTRLAAARARLDAARRKRLVAAYGPRWFVSMEKIEESLG